MPQTDCGDYLMLLSRERPKYSGGIGGVRRLAHNFVSQYDRRIGGEHDFIGGRLHGAGFHFPQSAGHNRAGARPRARRLIDVPRRGR